MEIAVLTLEELELIDTVQDIVGITQLVFTLVATVYGITSWYFLKKFRSYRNYVYLNVVFTTLLQIMSVKLLHPHSLVHTEMWVWFFCKYLKDYLLSTKSNWLLVLIHLFYVDFVKVFEGHNIQRKYLKSTVFAWGTSLVTTVIFGSMNYYLSQTGLVTNHSMFCIIILLTIGNTVLVLIANSILFIVIVYSLCRSFNTSTNTATGIWRRLYIAILIFLLSDVVMLSPIILLLFPKTYASLALQLSYILFNTLNAFVLSVFFIVVKSNREIWYKFYVNKIKRRSSLAGRDMHEIIHREPVVCRPAVLDV